MRLTFCNFYIADDEAVPPTKKQKVSTEELPKIQPALLLDTKDIGECVCTDYPEKHMQIELQCSWNYPYYF